MRATLSKDEDLGRRLRKPKEAGIRRRQAGLADESSELSRPESGINRGFSIAEQGAFLHLTGSFFRRAGPFLRRTGNRAFARTPSRADNEAHGYDPGPESTER
jgi:hypothetical protein